MRLLLLKYSVCVRKLNNSLSKSVAQVCEEKVFKECKRINTLLFQGSRRMTISNISKTSLPAQHFHKVPRVSLKRQSFVLQRCMIMHCFHLWNKILITSQMLYFTKFCTNSFFASSTVYKSFQRRVHSLEWAF